MTAQSHDATLVFFISKITTQDRMNIDVETSKDQVIDFLLNIQNGKEELLGESPFMRVVNDMLGAFIELFQKQPIMAGMISTPII